MYFTAGNYQVLGETVRVTSSTVQVWRRTEM